MTDPLDSLPREVVSRFKLGSALDKAIGAPRKGPDRNFLASHTDRAPSECVALLADHGAAMNVGSLYLSNAKFDEGSLAALARLPMLRGVFAIQLAHDHLPDEAMAALLSSPHLGALKTLYITGNSLGPKSAEAIAANPSLDALASLHIGGAELTDDALATVLTRLRKCPLVELDVQGNTVGAPSLEALSALEGRTTLKTLDLTKTGLDARSLEAFAKLPSMPKLDRLHLSLNDLDDAAVRALSTWAGAPSLTTLSLMASRFGADGAEALGAGALLVPVRTLMIGMTPLTGEAIARLLTAAAASSSRLQWVLGGDMPIDDEGAASIANGTAPTGFARLDLPRGKITDVGLRALAASETLPAQMMFDLRNNAITMTAAQTRKLSKRRFTF